MKERRAEPRQRVLKAGKIVFNDLKSLYDCQIRDLTRTGARVCLDRSCLVPEQFEFAGAAGSERRSARVVWRGDADLGIALE